MTDDRIARKVRVTGRVQGVYFRGWTKSEAERLGLGGWVRNEHDGAVSALIAGPAEKVAEILRLMHRGPPAARVDEVIVEETQADAAPWGFSVAR